MKKVFKPASGSRISKKDAAVVGAALDKLGTFDPEKIVAAAKSPKSPLHRFFEWSPTKAHHQYLIWRARNLVRSIEVEIIGVENAYTTKAFHSVFVGDGEDRERQYVGVDSVRQNRDLSQQVLENGLRDLERFRDRYNEWKSVFGEVFVGIKTAKAKIAARRTRYAKAGT